MQINEEIATGERIAFLTLSKQLASSSNSDNHTIAEDDSDNSNNIKKVSTNWRAATIATEEGLMNGNFAGLSEDGRFLRVANLETPLGKVDKCSLRDTDVLFTRFQMTEEELIQVNAARRYNS